MFVNEYRTVIKQRTFSFTERENSNVNFACHTGYMRSKGSWSVTSLCTEFLPLLRCFVKVIGAQGTPLDGMDFFPIQITRAVDFNALIAIV